MQGPTSSKVCYLYASRKANVAMGGGQDWEYDFRPWRRTPTSFARNRQPTRASSTEAQTHGRGPRAKGLGAYCQLLPPACFTIACEIFHKLVSLALSWQQAITRRASATEHSISPR